MIRVLLASILLCLLSMPGFADSSVRLNCKGVPVTFPPATTTSVFGVMEISENSRSKMLRFDLNEQLLTGHSLNLQRQYLTFVEAADVTGVIPFLCGMMPNTRCAQISYLPNKGLKDLIASALSGDAVSFMLSFDPNVNTQTYSFFFQMTCHVEKKED